jgi:hypothetical protein
MPSFRQVPRDRDKVRRSVDAGTHPGPAGAVTPPNRIEDTKDPRAEPDRPRAVRRIAHGTRPTGSPVSTSLRWTQ